jgi:hypothetical protein
VLVRNSRDLVNHEVVPDLDTSSTAHAAAGHVHGLSTGTSDHQDSAPDRVSVGDDMEAQNSLSDLRILPEPPATFIPSLAPF